MRAMVQDRYGTPDTLELRDVERPQPGSNEVLIRVAAAGVNPADWAGTMGVPYVARVGFGITRPRHGIRGSDVAGTVEAVGDDVAGLRVGDPVFGVARGSYAEYSVGRAEHLVTKPDRVTFEQAGATPMAGLAALQAVRDKGRLQAGQHILVNGASGGIGTFAVQLAKAMGAEVTGVCSTSNVERVRGIGADHVIDYTLTDFTEGTVRYDVILDNAGDHTLSHLRRALTATGTLVPNAGDFGNRWFASLGTVIAAAAVSPFSRQNLRPFLSLPNQADLARLAELMASGAVVPVVSRVFGLPDAGAALALVGGGHPGGKVVVCP